jgi:carbonic anhydrase
MTTRSFINSFLILLLVLAGCKGETASPNAIEEQISKEKPLREQVLTAEEQKALTPDQVLESLKKGNENFTGDGLTLRDHSAMVRKAASGQYPKAVILSCLDSRIPVEDIFDKGIGDLFVARVAGNLVNEDILGSMEFGCKVAGAKLILVMGHNECGAVKAGIDNVQLGNITSLVNKIRPAVDSSSNFNGDKVTKNNEYVDNVAQNNVRLNMSLIKSKSDILREMVEKGEIKIVGAFYDLNTGKVTFID